MTKTKIKDYPLSFFSVLSLSNCWTEIHVSLSLYRDKELVFSGEITMFLNENNKTNLPNPTPFSILSFLFN